MAFASVAVTAALVPAVWRDRHSAHSLDVATVTIFPSLAFTAAVLAVLVVIDQQPLGGHLWSSFAAIVVALGGGALLALLVFGVGSIASLAVLRPIARSHLRQPRQMRTGTAALVGARAVVVEQVGGNGGRIKLAGEVWSARSFDEHSVIEPGTPVQVAAIEGATALVYE